MYNFLTRHISKSHSATSNFTNIYRKVSKTYKKTCSIRKRSLSTTSNKSEKEAEDNAPEPLYRFTTEGMPVRTCSLTCTKNHQYNSTRTSIFSEKPKTAPTGRPYTTIPNDVFCSGYRHLKRKPTTDIYCYVKDNDIYKQPANHYSKIKHQKTTGSNPYLSANLQLPQIKVKDSLIQIKIKTVVLESHKPLPRKKQLMATKHLPQVQKNTKIKKNCVHHTPEESFKIKHPVKKVKKKAPFGRILVSCISDNKLNKKMKGIYGTAIRNGLKRNQITQKRKLSYMKTSDVSNKAYRGKENVLKMDKKMNNAHDTIHPYFRTLFSNLDIDETIVNTSLENDSETIQEQGKNSSLITKKPKRSKDQDILIPYLPQESIKLDMTYYEPKRREKIINKISCDLQPDEMVKQIPSGTNHATELKNEEMMPIKDNMENNDLIMDIFKQIESNKQIPSGTNHATELKNEDIMPIKDNMENNDLIMDILKQIESNKQIPPGTNHATELKNKDIMPIKDNMKNNDLIMDILKQIESNKQIPSGTNHDTELKNEDIMPIKDNMENNDLIMDILKQIESNKQIPSGTNHATELNNEEIMPIKDNMENNDLIMDIFKHIETINKLSNHMLMDNNDKKEVSPEDEVVEETISRKTDLETHRVLNKNTGSSKSVSDIQREETNVSSHTYCIKQQGYDKEYNQEEPLCRVEKTATEKYSKNSILGGKQKTCGLFRTEDIPLTTNACNMSKSAAATALTGSISRTITRHLYKNSKEDSSKEEKKTDKYKQKPKPLVELSRLKENSYKKKYAYNDTHTILNPRTSAKQDEKLINIDNERNELMQILASKDFVLDKGELIFKIPKFGTKLLKQEIEDKKTEVLLNEAQKSTNAEKSLIMHNVQTKSNKTRSAIKTISEISEPVMRNKLQKQDLPNPTISKDLNSKTVLKFDIGFGQRGTAKENIVKAHSTIKGQSLLPSNKDDNVKKKSRKPKVIIKFSDFYKKHMLDSDSITCKEFDARKDQKSGRFSCQSTTANITTPERKLKNNTTSHKHLPEGKPLLRKSSPVIKLKKPNVSEKYKLYDSLDICGNVPVKANRVERPSIRKPPPSNKKNDKSKDDKRKPKPAVRFPPSNTQDKSKLNDDPSKPKLDPKKELKSDRDADQTVILQTNAGSNHVNIDNLVMKDDTLRDRLKHVIAYVEELQSKCKDSDQTVIFQTRGNHVNIDNLVMKDDTVRNRLKYVIAYVDELQSKCKDSDFIEQVKIVDKSVKSQNEVPQFYSQINETNSYMENDKKTSSSRKPLQQFKQVLKLNANEISTENIEALGATSPDNAPHSKPQSSKKQPVPPHIVRKIMKLKLQRDKVTHHNEEDDNENSFSVVTNSQEITINKPILKTNHSDSSLMTMFLLEDCEKEKCAPDTTRPTTASKTITKSENDNEGKILANMIDQYAKYIQKKKSKEVAPAMPRGNDIATNLKPKNVRISDMAVDQKKIVGEINDDKNNTSRNVAKITEHLSQHIKLLKTMIENTNTVTDNTKETHTKDINDVSKNSKNICSKLQDIPATDIVKHYERIHHMFDKNNKENVTKIIEDSTNKQGKIDDVNKKTFIARDKPEIVATKDVRKDQNINHCQKFTYKTSNVLCNINDSVDKWGCSKILREKVNIDDKVQSQVPFKKSANKEKSNASDTGNTNANVRRNGILLKGSVILKSTKEKLEKPKRISKVQSSKVKETNKSIQNANLTDFVLKEENSTSNAEFLVPSEKRSNKSSNKNKDETNLTFHISVDDIHSKINNINQMDHKSELANNSTSICSKVDTESILDSNELVAKRKNIVSNSSKHSNIILDKKSDLQNQTAEGCKYSPKNKSQVQKTYLNNDSKIITDNCSTNDDSSPQIEHNKGSNEKTVQKDLNVDEVQLSEDNRIGIVVDTIEKPTNISSKQLTSPISKKSVTNVSSVQNMNRLEEGNTSSALLKQKTKSDKGVIDNNNTPIENKLATSEKKIKKDANIDGLQSGQNFIRIVVNTDEKPKNIDVVQTIKYIKPIKTSMEKNISETQTNRNNITNNNVTSDFGRVRKNYFNDDSKALVDEKVVDRNKEAIAQPTHYPETLVLIDVQRSNTKHMISENFVKTPTKNSSLQLILSKTPLKSSKALNEEESNSYFNNQDYSYIKRRAQKMAAFKKYVQSKEYKNCFKSKTYPKENLDVKKDVHSVNIMNDQNSESFRKFSTVSKEGIENFAKANYDDCTLNHKATFKPTDPNKNSINMCTKDPDKPSDAKFKDKKDKVDKESAKSKKKKADANKKVKKFLPTTDTRIVKAPTSFRPCRRHKKPSKPPGYAATYPKKSQKSKTDKKADATKNYKRRNRITYLLKNQLISEEDKSNLRSLLAKEDLERTMERHKINPNQINDIDFYSVSKADTELYNRKRSREKMYKDFRRRMSGLFQATKISPKTGGESKVKSVSASNVAAPLPKQPVDISKDPVCLKNKANVGAVVKSSQKCLIDSPTTTKCLNTDKQIKSTVPTKSTSSEYSLNTQVVPVKDQNVKPGRDSSIKSDNNKKSSKTQDKDKDSPKATLIDKPDASKTSTNLSKSTEKSKEREFAEVLREELTNIFENGPPEVVKHMKMVAKVEEFVDNHKIVRRFNKKLYDHLKTPRNSPMDLITPVTIEKDLPRYKNISKAPKVAECHKKECVSILIPPRDLRRLLDSLKHNEVSTVLNMFEKKPMFMQKVDLQRYYGPKITYVPMNKSETVPEIPIKSPSKDENNKNSFMNKTINEKFVHIAILKYLQEIHNFEKEIIKNLIGLSKSSPDKPKGPKKIKDKEFEREEISSEEKIIKSIADKKLSNPSKNNSKGKNSDDKDPKSK